eukprot:458403-Rhodomonas_salina.2
MRAQPAQMKNHSSEHARERRTLPSSFAEAKRAQMRPPPRSSGWSSMLPAPIRSEIDAVPRATPPSQKEN